MKSKPLREVWRPIPKRCKAKLATFKRREGQTFVVLDKCGLKSHPRRRWHRGEFVTWSQTTGEIRWLE